MARRRRNRIPRLTAALATAGLTWTLALAATHASAAPSTSPSAAPPTPATAPAADNGEAMRVVVGEVVGLVQVRENETAPWKKATRGMELGEAAEFRTGPRSSVTCKIPPDQTFIVDRLGVVK